MPEDRTGGSVDDPAATARRPPPPLCSSNGWRTPHRTARHDLGVARWTCPACDREFGRVHQSHVCVPGCTVDECFAGRPPVYRFIYDTLMAHVRTLGPVHIDAVGVGVFLKRDRKFAEVRPKARGLSLAVVLPRTVHHPRISRTIRTSDERVAHVIKLLDPGDVDDEVCDWLTEAYLTASD
jgi:hypothetical protein